MELCWNAAGGEVKQLSTWWILSDIHFLKLEICPVVFKAAAAAGTSHVMCCIFPCIEQLELTNLLVPVEERHHASVSELSGWVRADL